MKAATTDMGAPHKSFVGTLYIGGTHPAASGGAWMAAVFGLCGISVKTPADNERLKGVSRMRSLEILLEIGGLIRDEEERRILAERKNEWSTPPTGIQTPRAHIPS